MPRRDRFHPLSFGAARARRMWALAALVMAAHLMFLAQFLTPAQRFERPALTARLLALTSPSPPSPPQTAEAPEAPEMPGPPADRAAPMMRAAAAQPANSPAAKPPARAAAHRQIATAELPTQPAAAGDEASATAPSPLAEEGLAPAPPPPTYATRPPDPVRLMYALRIGAGAAARAGLAQLDWQHDGQRYLLDLQARTADGGPLLWQTSQGLLDEHGLAPDRYSDQRHGQRGRVARMAANFQRDSARITFSGPRNEYPAWPGAQDRLGWIAQLAAIAQAAGGLPAEVSLFVVDARGAGRLWRIQAAGAETLDLPGGALATLKVQREPQALHDWGVQAWLDPQRGYWPVRLQMSLPERGVVFALDLQGAAGAP